MGFLTGDSEAVQNEEGWEAIGTKFWKLILGEIFVTEIKFDFNPMLLSPGK